MSANTRQVINVDTETDLSNTEDWNWDYSDITRDVYNIIYN